MAHRPLKRLVQGIAAGLGLLLLWQLFSLGVNRPFVPEPLLVFRYLFSHKGSVLLSHVSASLLRILSALILAGLGGGAAGLAMGYFPLAGKYLSPLVYFIYPIPKIAFLPLFMLFFGLGEGSRIGMLVFILLFQVIVASRDAASAIAPETFQILRSLGASHGTVLRLAVIPGVLPSLLSALRVGLATALSVLFFTETYGTRQGLGYFIMDAWMRVAYVEMFGGILTLSVAGFILFFGVDALEKRLCRWRS